MQNKFRKIITCLAILLLPNVSFAALQDIIDSSFNIVKDVLIPLAFFLCLLYFFWGIAKYIRTGAGSEKAAEEGKRIMVWGVVALFVVTSIWGIISFIRSELGIPGTTEIRPIRNN